MTVRLWDVATHDELITLRGILAWSPPSHFRGMGLRALRRALMAQFVCGAPRLLEPGRSPPFWFLPTLINNLLATSIDYQFFLPSRDTAAPIKEWRISGP